MSKRVKKILAGSGLLAAFGLGGAAIAGAQSDSGEQDHKTEQSATGPEASRAGQAALQAVGGGKVPVGREEDTRDGRGQERLR